MLRAFLSISFTIGLFVIMSAFSPARAATITVNTLADEDNTNAAGCSLREAIANANSDSTANGLGCAAGSGADTIAFGVSGTIGLTAALQDISTSINIGTNLTTTPAVTITRVSGGGYRIFNVTSAVASTINGLIITNGNSANEGGGIKNTGLLTVRNCTITNNTAIGEGGGIANSTGSTLSVIDTTFSNNSSGYEGGGLGTYGPVTILRSTFTGNTAALNGGAIAVQNGGGFDGSITASNVTLTNNTAGSAGGGISVDSSTAQTLTNCTITQNRQLNNGSAGGGIAIFSGSVTLRNNIVIANTKNTNNTPSDIERFAGTIVASSPNNLIGTGGSGTLVNGTNGNQTGVANARLRPLGSYGGLVQTIAIAPNSPARNTGTNSGAPATDARGFARPQGVADIGAFEIQTNSIVLNTANSGAGSLRDTVANVPAGEIVQFETPLFNSAQTIQLSAGQITLDKNITIYGNGANLLTIQNTAAPSSTSRGFLINAGFNVTLAGLTVSGGNVNGVDNATGSGGGIYNDGGDLTLNGVVVDGNFGAYRAGGIFSEGGRLVVNNAAIINNSLGTAVPNGGGGGIYALNTTFVMANSTVSGNSALGSNFKRGGVDAVGPANNTTITNSTIANNITEGSGSFGGFSNGNGVSTVRGSIIAANQNNGTYADVNDTNGITSGGYNLIGNVGLVTAFNAIGDQTGSSPLTVRGSNGKQFAPTAVLDPHLLALALNGGTVPTHAFNGPSPAIDGGNSFGLTTDARGLARPIDLVGAANAPGGDGADIGAYEAQLAPTAANVNVAGRVLAPNGSGLANTVVTMTSADGSSRTALTGPFGYFEIEGLPAGSSYIIGVQSKRFVFNPQVLSLSESIGDLEIRATEI